MITDDYVENTCMPGQQEKTCRYLAMSPDGWRCAKLMPDTKAYIDQRVSAGTMVARGDNCEGQ